MMVQTWAIKSGVIEMDVFSGDLRWAWVIPVAGVTFMARKGGTSVVALETGGSADNPIQAAFGDAEQAAAFEREVVLEMRSAAR